MDALLHLKVSLYFCFVGSILGKDELVVLCTEHNSVDADRDIVIAVFDGHLALGIRSEISHLFLLATNFSQHNQQAVSQIQTERHIIVGLVGSIAKHHALVARSLVFANLTIHTSIDVCTLFVNGREDSTRISFEHVLCLGVADAVDHFACNALEVYVGLCLDFASQDYLASGNKCLASNFCLRVECQYLV